MPARPSRKPRDASQETVRALQRVTPSGKVSGDAVLGSPKSKPQFATPKKHVGAARGR